MRRMSVVRLFTLVLALAIALPAYAASGSAAQSSSTVTIKKGDKITIGWAGDLSLQLIKPSQGILYGATVAVNRTNTAGGIKGFQVAIESQDDQCTGTVATTVAQKFASESYILAIVGHVCSGATIPASDIYEKARIPIVSASATADKVTNRGLDVVNRVAFNDNNQGIADAYYITHDLKGKNVAVYDDNQAYGVGLASAIATYVTDFGGTVVDRESVDANSKDYRPLLTKLVANPPDVLFFGGYFGPAALLTQQMHELGMTKTIFFSDDGTYTADYLQTAGKDAEGQYSSSVGQATDAASADVQTAFQNEFEKTFSVKFHDYDPYQAAGFDAAQIILNAISSVAQTDSSGNLTVDREALIKAVRATKGYQGLLGVLSCDSKGECGAGTISENQVKGGQWVLIKSYSKDDITKLYALLPAATPAPTAAASSGGSTSGGAPAPSMAATMAGTMGATMAPSMAPTMAATK